MAKTKVHIKDHLTRKTKQLRVEITEILKVPDVIDTTHSYSVTVGGLEWEKGVGRKHIDLIIPKLKALQVRLNTIHTELLNTQLDENNND